MNYFLQTLASARFMAAFCSGVAVDIASLFIRAGFPGADWRQPAFLASPKKVGKERRPQVRRPYALPCAAYKRGPLRNSGSWLRWRKWFASALALRKSSRTTPALAPLLGNRCIGFPHGRRRCPSGHQRNPRLSCDSHGDPCCYATTVI